MVMFLLIILNRHKIAFHKNNQTKEQKGKRILETIFSREVYI